MTADEILSYGELYLAALRLLAKSIDHAALLRFELAAETATKGAEQITNLVQQYERLAAELRMRNEQTLIERHCVIPKVA